MTTDELLKTNQDRHRAIEAPFNPITGEGAFGVRVPLEISGFPIATQYVPKEMMSNPPIKRTSSEVSALRYWVINLSIDLDLQTCLMRGLDIISLGTY